MAGNTSLKLKTFVLKEILNEKTDEDHPLNACELAEELAKRGISAERKSVYNDIAVLQNAGCDIIKSSGPKRGFFMGGRDFEISEARLLIDAVQSAKFITRTKTRQLIKKIEASLSTWQREYLSNQVYTESRSKTDNEFVYYTIDTAYNAIQRERKLSVHYKKRRVERCGDSGYEERVMKISPYALIWVNDYYYLVGNYDKYDNLIHLRIDKIKELSILEDEEARPFSEVCEYRGSFDVASYTAKTFNMFSGKTERVVLRCDKEFSNVVFDRFGDDVLISERDDSGFTVVTEAEVSEGFVSFIMQYAGKISVLKPEALRDEIISKTQRALEIYRENAQGGAEGKSCKK